MPKKAKNTDQNIKALKGADRVRRRPAVIFGSDGLEGCEHAFFEILSNAVDEAREGYGREISVTVFNDRSITVDDRGRGVPLGYNENEKRWNWDLIYNELYAGGKYETGQYEFALGTNGLGACSTQYASEFMTVTSYDGQNKSVIRFKNGKPVSKTLEVTPLAKDERRTGTTVHWKPDLKVFTEIDIPKEFFDDMLYRQAVVNRGICFIFKFQKEDGEFEESKFFFENGIPDYLANIVGDSAVTEPVFWHMETKGRDRPDKPEYRLKADFAFCLSSKTPLIEYYHNSSLLEYGGSPARAVKSAFAYAVDQYLKAQGKYNKNETRINFNDIADSLVLIVNSFSTSYLTSYENQTKKSVTNPFIYEAMNEYLRKNLAIYFTEKPMEAESFVNRVLVNKRSRESAEAARINIKKKLSGTMDIANRVQKFVSCRSKDPNLRELYIVEGDSAMTSCKLSRNAEFQAIIPVRGKTFNCIKGSYDKLFKNDIIMDLLKVIGCGVETEGKIKGDIVKFDLDALRWNKIIICTDADEDGFHIRTLLLTMFYKLLPTLIREEKIFIAETPLFEIRTKDETLFAYDEFEKAEILKSLGNKKYTIQRSKGLGENDPDMMSITTMHPETRRLISVLPDNAEKTFEMFDTLLGDNLPARKLFITENGSKYIKEADI